MKNPKYIFISLGFTALIVFGYFLLQTPKTEANPSSNNKTNNDSSDIDKLDTAFLKSVFELDTTSVLDGDSLIINGEDMRAGSSRDEFAGYNRINIALIGVDGRMGAPRGHADANHIISIIPDAGKIQIISIPRDTYVDCGYDDTTNLNKLTVYYMGAGREAYLEKIAEIAGLGSIKYYVEFGFSQAMGMLRLFGYNSTQTLQVLRSRKSFAIGDYQRVYNQAQFVRQLILRHFDLTNGSLKPVFINGILALVRTNMNYDIVSNIFDTIEEKGIHKNPDNISIKIKPGVQTGYKVFDFSNPEVIASLRGQLKLESIAKQDTTAFSPKNFQEYLSNKLNNIIFDSAKDTIKNPRLAINKLKPYYEQKIWLQIGNEEESLEFSRKVSDIMTNSYLKIKDTTNARKIQNAFLAEQELFNKSKSK